MKRYVLLEIDETGLKTRVDAAEIDVQTGEEFAHALETFRECSPWSVGLAHGVPVAAALAVEELLR